MLDHDRLSAIRVDDLPPTRRTLRVAVVTETYPPEVNGVSLTTAQVVQGLRDRDHHVRLVRPRQSSDDSAGIDALGLNEVLLRGLPIPRYPHLRMGLPAKRALVDHWSRHRPDLVHIVTEGPLGWSALQAAIRLKLPVCSDFRTNFHAYSRHYGMGWLHKPIVSYLRKFHNRSQFTMVPTEALSRELQEYGFRRLRVVARGVDTVKFDPAKRSAELRARWGCSDNTRVALVVGRLAPEKNLSLFLDATEAMRRVAPDLKVVLVGDGPAARELQARSPTSIFAGAQSGEALSAHYASADYFIFPSLTETYGNVVPEAMASGLAVLAYDCAAAGQLIRPRENGLLAPVGRADRFIEMAALLASDPQAAASMAVNARASAESMSWERIVSQVEATYLASIESFPADLAGSRSRNGYTGGRPSANGIRP